MTVLSKAKELVLPLPVALVTCRAKEKDTSTDNIVPLAWVGIVEYSPPMVDIVIGKGKYSERVISNRKEFGLCIATVDMMEKVDRCGLVHGDKVDKFKMTGFTKLEATKIDVSLIKECPISLECIVKDTIPVETHKIFIAEVVCTHVDERFIGESGEIKAEEMNILCYGNGSYWMLGKKLEKLFYTKE
ncbi:MAG: flavin reductase family protein [Actinobacteria bacterium]|nr:flavin reductase family protein [Actinomycetota bacterium]